MIIQNYDKETISKGAILTLLAVSADIITLKTDALQNIFGDDFPDWAKWISLTILLPIFGFLLLGLYKYTFEKYLCRIGVNNQPASIMTFLRMRILNRNALIFGNLHREIYHYAYIARDRIYRKIVKQDEINVQVSDFISHVNTAIYNSIGLDLSIRVLIFAEQDGVRYLIPSCNSRSKNEDTACYSRNYNEKYTLITDDSSNLTTHFIKSQEYHQRHGNADFCVSSILSYLSGHSETRWLSNNIAKDCKNQNYFSSSDSSLHGLYNSIAIFKMFNPGRARKSNGFVVFDSKQKGAFTNEECVPLFGMIAHLIYEMYTIEIK